MGRIQILLALKGFDRDDCPKEQHIFLSGISNLRLSLLGKVAGYAMRVRKLREIFKDI